MVRLARVTILSVITHRLLQNDTMRLTRGARSKFNMVHRTHASRHPKAFERRECPTMEL